MALRDGWARCDGCGAKRGGLSFSVVDRNRIVVPVEVVSHNNALWVDKSEGIDNDFAFDRLDRVNHDCNRTSVETFK